MAIAFTCECGKALRARDELAGKKTKCPQCGAILAIPTPEVDPDLGDGLPYSLQDPDPRPGSRPNSPFDDEMAIRPSVFHASPSEPRMDDPWSRPTTSRPASKPATSFKPMESSDSGSSIREYAYLLLVFALVPLIFSLLGKEEKLDLPERIEQTLKKATPEQLAKAIPVLNKETTSLDEVISALPDARLEGAHLSRDTVTHWVYAGIATVGFLLFIMLFFSVERANPLHLLGIGLFTGTVGIVFLLAVQFCSQVRLGMRLRVPWPLLIVLLILWFIGWSYDSAERDDSNFLLSAIGFTFGVGLCEEFTKAIPLFFYFQRDASMGWRGACLWGLASGIGFGVSEGIMYSSRYYNGIGGVDIYIVRFISCVALHAMWSASVGIAIARKLDDYEQVTDVAGFGLFMLRIIAVPMLLHGFYDTLLKKEMNVWALLVALISFAWLAMQIELARGDQPDAGGPRKKKKKLAY
jgi:RsiW-degrading membrane proteinase PrsW (M82 family)